MSTASAQVLVPSLLPEDAEDWARAFAVRLRDDVSLPLFAAADADAFAEALPDCLTRGAVLRFRWLNALNDMPKEQANALLNEWMRPPPPSVLSELQRRAAHLLGDERSFQLQRALALTFTDGMDGVEAVLAKWSAPRHGPRWFVEMARLTEAGATHDVLAIAWMAVLLGDVRAPHPDVADAAATALLAHTAERLAAMQAVVRDEIPVRDVTLDDRAVRRHWLDSHRSLVLPLLTLLGLAFDDNDVDAIALAHRQDPEDAQLSMLEIRLYARGEPDDARLRVEDRALRAGVLGMMSDGRGAMLAITSVAAPVP